MPKKGVTLSADAKKKQDAAIAAWKLANVENLSIGLRKGKRDAYKRLAAARGVSISAMVQEYLDAEYLKEFGEAIETARG